MMRFALFGVALLVSGCSSDTLLEGEVQTPVASKVWFEQPVPAAEPACVSVGQDEGARVPMLVGYEQLLLRPPGACPLGTACGHLRLFADGVWNNDGATPAIDLVFDRIGDRYHDGQIHASTGEADVLSVVVQVVGDDDEPLVDDQGATVEGEIKLVTVPDCDAAPSP